MKTRNNGILRAGWAMALLVAAGCGTGGDAVDDTAIEGSTGEDPSEGSTTTEASSETTGPSDPATTGSTSTGETGGQDDDDEYAVLVRGTLFTDDLDEAQALHDAIASAGQPLAHELGDFGHEPLLGTAALGTTPDEFLAIDRWYDLDGIAQLFANEEFGEAFGMLFAAPPVVETFVHRPDWLEWGDFDAGRDADPRYLVVVRGRLLETDPQAARDGHDAVAMAGMEAVIDAGDVAHLVYLGVEDPQEFLAIDIWTHDGALEAVYTDPAFVAAFSTLFDGQPSLGVYRSTDWYAW
jgi:hypothetical protein